MGLLLLLLLLGCLLVLVKDGLAATVAEVMEMLRSCRVVVCRVMDRHVVEWAMTCLLRVDEWVVHVLRAGLELPTGEKLVGTAQAVVGVVKQVDHARVGTVGAHRVKHDLSLVCCSVAILHMLAQLHMRVQMML